MLDLELAKHCQLCERQIINFEVGSLCELTQKNPDFVGTCSEILLGEKMEKNLTEINIAYKKAVDAKPVVYYLQSNLP